jgi:hypothetical protein
MAPETARRCKEKREGRCGSSAEGFDAAACSRFDVQGMWAICPATLSKELEDEGHFLRSFSAYPNR